jgi:hypothetical protein
VEIYEITQIYGSGPFGHAGATKVFVTETIKSWLGRAEKDPEGIIHDLFVMSPLRVGPFPYSTPQVMDRLERLSARIADPHFEALYRRFPQVEGAAV